MSLHKWIKVPIVLKFAIHSVTLVTETPGGFKVRWSHRRSKGATSRTTSEKKLVSFNEDFTFKCTMFVSRGSRSIREKCMKFVCERCVSYGPPQVSGELSLDIGPFYKEGGRITVDKPMTTPARPGPAVAGPTLRLTFHFDDAMMRASSVQSSVMRPPGELGSSDSENSDDEANLPPFERAVDRSYSAVATFMERHRGTSRVALLHIKARRLFEVPEKLLYKARTRLIESVLAQVWAAPISPGFIWPLVPYPPAVFPIFAMIIHTEMLKADPNGLMATFVEGLPRAQFSADCPPDTRFLICMLVFILAGSFGGEYEFNEALVSKFHESLGPILDEYLVRLVDPCVTPFEKAVRRLASAQFQADDLIRDFSRTFARVSTLLPGPEQLQPFLCTAILNVLDSLILLRILGNPWKLTIGNAQILSSFFNQLATEFREQFTLASEAMSVLHAARTICRSPRDADVIAPHLPKEVVFFLLANLKPDDLFSGIVDASRFLDAFPVNPAWTAKTVVPFFSSDYMSLAQHMQISDWNACEINEAVLAEFSFLRMFLAEPEEEEEEEEEAAESATKEHAEPQKAVSVSPDESYSRSSTESESP
jgi:hypothetical protein